MDHTRYQQWKQSWLTCGRILLTLSCLTVLTLVLYIASQHSNIIDDHPPEVRYRRDIENASIKQIHHSTNSYKNSQHKKQLNKTLDTSITSVTNDNKTFPSSNDDKSKHFDAITYHTDTRQTVEGGSEQRMKYVAHNKHKIKKKTKEKHVKCKK